MTMRSKGLWLPGTRVEIQEVKKAHKKPCDGCGDLPEDRRVLLRDGSGRGATSRVLCAVCGHTWIAQLIAEGKRAIRYLHGNLDAAIRLESPMRQTLKPKTAPKDED